MTEQEEFIVDYDDNAENNEENKHPMSRTSTQVKQ